jgi:hypothetical protein
VKKEGAFLKLEASFSILYRAGASIELRTVLMNSNAKELPQLASYISTNLPFVFRWAIMQLERIGYGRQNWATLFYDNSLDFAPVGHALDVAHARGIDTLLFNFPLCTVPEFYRLQAPSTISDWKRRYLPTCADCRLKVDCGGFFEWYDEKAGFSTVGLT